MDKNYNNLKQTWCKSTYAFVKRIFLEAGMSCEKAHKAAILEADLGKSNNDYAILFALWQEAAQKSGDFYNGHAIVPYQDLDGWGFELRSPDGVRHDGGGNYRGYRTRSRARLEGRRDILKYLISGSLLDLLSELQEQGKMSSAQYKKLEEFVMTTIYSLERFITLSQILEITLLLDVVITKKNETD